MDEIFIKTYHTLESVFKLRGEYLQIRSVESLGPRLALHPPRLAVSLLLPLPVGPVEAGHVARVEGELPGGVPGAGVDAPPAGRALQLTGPRLSQQTVQLLSLPDHLQHGLPAGPVHLHPPLGQPGGVEDAEEAPPYPRALRPEGLHQTVAHHRHQQLGARLLQHLAGRPAGRQHREVEDGDVVLPLPAGELGDGQLGGEVPGGEGCGLDSEVLQLGVVDVARPEKRVPAELRPLNNKKIKLNRNIPHLLIITFITPFFTRLSFFTVITK